MPTQQQVCRPQGEGTEASTSTGTGEWQRDGIGETVYLDFVCLIFSHLKVPGAFALLQVFQRLRKLLGSGLWDIAALA